MKMLRLTFLFVLIHFSTQSPLKVSIYYESLCYDSIQFIKHQLAPSYNSYKDNITLDFVPFGKATHNKVNNDWTFSCQHGPNECKGNMRHACGLEYANTQDKKMAFIKCVMSDRRPAMKRTAIRCATSNGISSDDLNTCFTSEKGKNLLAAHGDKTYSVEPSINFVPTIIFNDVYDNHLQNRALQDLGGTIRSLLTIIA